MAKVEPKRVVRGNLCKDCEFIDYTGALCRCPYCHGNVWKKVDLIRCDQCKQWKEKD